MLGFDNTFTLDGVTSYIASLAIIDFADISIVEPHNRVEHRRANKTKRTPEIVREGLLRMSPVAVHLSENEKVLVINLSLEELQGWALRSRVSSFIYVCPSIDGAVNINHLHWNLQEKSWKMSRITSPLVLSLLEAPADMLTEINKTLSSNLQQVSQTTGMDIMTLLDWATNRVGYRASHIRRQIYSLSK